MKLGLRTPSLRKSRSEWFMEPHAFEHDGANFEIRFERTAEAWFAHLFREGVDTGQNVQWLHAHIWSEDTRKALIASCEAIAANIPWPGTVRH